MAILPNAIYRLNTVSIKIPTAFFTKLKEKSPKCGMEPQKSWVDKAVLTKNRGRSIMLCDFKLYHKPRLIKAVWHWHKNGHKEQCHRIETPEITCSLMVN